MQNVKSKAPHPTPLPEGEGTDRVLRERYAEVRYRAELELQSVNQQPLTLTLSQREKGLTEVFWSDTPKCDTAVNLGFEKPKNRLPLPRERAGRAAFR